MGSYKKNENIDITGKRFGRLTAIKKVKHASWLCKCDCGNEVTLCYSQLGAVKSCGCLRADAKKNFAKQAKKHGEYNTRLYRLYTSVKSRCYYTKHREYHRYGGRGITMCDEWKNSYVAFKEWALTNGYDYSKTGIKQSIERIDNNKGYCPENCCFVTSKEQALNRETTYVCEYQGKKYSAFDFANTYGLPYIAVKCRLKKGIEPTDIIAELKSVHELPSYLMTVNEAAAKYSKSTGDIRRMLKQGKLKGEHIGWRWFVYREQ